MQVLNLVILRLLRIPALLLRLFIDKPVHLLAKSLLYRIREKLGSYREFDSVDKNIERVALNLHSGSLDMPSVTAHCPTRMKLAIVLHGTDTVPEDLFDNSTYLNNIGNRLVSRGYTVFAPYLIREASRLQRIRLLSERVRDKYLEEDLAEGIAYSIPSHYEKVIVYGISWGAEVALSLAQIIKPDLLILSGLDPSPVDTIQDRFSKGKKLDPMYIPERKSLHTTLRELETMTILEYGDRDVDPELLDALHPWPDNVLELRFKGGHEINPTDTTLANMERLLDQKI